MFQGEAEFQQFVSLNILSIRFDLTFVFINALAQFKRMIWETSGKKKKSHFDQSNHKAEQQSLKWNCPSKINLQVEKQNSISCHVKMTPVTGQPALHQHRKTQNGALSSQGTCVLGPATDQSAARWPAWSSLSSFRSTRRSNICASLCAPQSSTHTRSSTASFKHTASLIGRGSSCRLFSNRC